MDFLELEYVVFNLYRVAQSLDSAKDMSHTYFILQTVLISLYMEIKEPASPLYSTYDFFKGVWPIIARDIGQLGKSDYV